MIFCNIYVEVDGKAELHFADSFGETRKRYASCSGAKQAIMRYMGYIPSCLKVWHVVPINK